MGARFGSFAIAILFASHIAMMHCTSIEGAEGKDSISRSNLSAVTSSSGSS